MINGKREREGKSLLLPPFNKLFWTSETEMEWPLIKGPIGTASVKF